MWPASCVTVVPTSIEMQPLGFCWKTAGTSTHCSPLSLHVKYHPRVDVAAPSQPKSSMSASTISPSATLKVVVVSAIVLAPVPDVSCSQQLYFPAHEPAVP